MRIWLLLFVLALSGCLGELSVGDGGRGECNQVGVATSVVASSASISSGDQLSAGVFPHLHNLLQITDRIFCGGEPAEEAAFAELVRLGIQTVVSVDGAQPRLDLAKRHGLRYVHIPIGYDGIPDDAGRSFAALIAHAEGPFYIHCHHGRHRGPAAAAVVGIASGELSHPAALAILERAGTSKGYGGLWRDVAGYRPPAAEVELPELVSVADGGSVATAMVWIDRAADNLKRCADVDWRVPAEHPDIAPAQQALLLKEGFRETIRQFADEVGDELLLAWLKQAEQAATQLHAALAAGDKNLADLAFRKVQDQCGQCHRDYRD